MTQAWHTSDARCGIGMTIHAADGQEWTYCHLSFLSPEIQAGVQLTAGQQIEYAKIAGELEIVVQDREAHLAHDVVGRAGRVDPSVIQHHRVVAQVAHLVERVRDEHDRPPVPLERADLVDAARLERLVADGKHLVDQDDLGLDVDRHREPEPDEHA